MTMLSKYLEPIKNAPSMGIESSALLAVGVWCWSKRWKLDGDVMWCRCCKRGIHITRMGAPLNHTAGCKNDDDLHPWHSLARLMAPIDALSSAPARTDEPERPEMPTANDLLSEPPVKAPHEDGSSGQGDGHGASL